MSTAPLLSPEPDRRVLRRGKDPSVSFSRSLFDDDEDEREFTISDIKNERSTGRAERLLSSKEDRFPKFRNFFRYQDDALAHAIRNQFNSLKTKADLQDWVDQNVGHLDNRKLNAQELEDVVFVSAAISKYGELYLEQQYVRGRMDSLRNRVPLESSDCRNEYMQQVKRNESSSEYLDEKEAAHYVGVEVGYAINDRLPIEQRLGEELRQIISRTSNMRMVLKKTNREFHVKVDNVLLNPDKYLADRYLTDLERERIKQIAKCAQSETFQSMLVEVKGQHFYKALRDSIKAMDKYHNYTETLWDGRKDKKELVRSDPTPAKPRGIQNASQSGSPGESKRVESTSHTSRAASESEETRKTTRSPPSVKSEADSAEAKPRRKARPQVKKASQPVPGVRLKSDGTPDRRFKENKTKASETQGGRSDRRQLTRSSSQDVSDLGLSDSRSRRSAWSEQEKAQAQPAKSQARRSSRGSEDQTLYTGARGGTYYLNSSGNKSYVKPEQATNLISKSSKSYDRPEPIYSPPPPVSTYARTNNGGGSSSYSGNSGSGGGGDRVLITGPRGGTYYINSNGNKTYVK